MDTRSKPTRAGYDIVFSPGEQTTLQMRHNPAFQHQLGPMLFEKLTPVLLHWHSGVSADQLELIQCQCPSGRKMSRHWGILIEVIYRLRHQSGSYRHVFHFIRDNGDLSGQLFTQTRRFIPAK